MNLKGSSLAKIVAILFCGVILGAMLNPFAVSSWTGQMNRLTENYIEWPYANITSIDTADLVATDWVNASKTNLSEVYWNSVYNRTDTLAHPEQSASYIIFTDGLNYYSKNGTTGQIDYSNLDYASVVQYSHDHLPNGGIIHNSVGNFILNTQLNVTNSNIIFEGEGDATVIDSSTMGTELITYSLTILGSEGANSLVTASVSNSYNNNVNVTNGALFSVGDIVKLNSTNLWATATLGELHKIESITGNVITMSEPIFGGPSVSSASYTVAGGARLTVLNTADNIILRDFTLLGNITGNYHRGINAQAVMNLHIENINILNFRQAKIRLLDVWSARITNCELAGYNFGSEVGGYWGYGVTMCYNTRNVEIDNNNIHDLHHGIEYHYSANNYGVQRFINVHDNYFHNIKLASFDSSASADYIDYTGNTVIGKYEQNSVIIIAYSVHVKISGNKLYIQQPSANEVEGIYATLAPTNANWEFSDNLIKGCRYGIRVLDCVPTTGFISILDNTMDKALYDNIFLDDSSNILVSGNTLIGDCGNGLMTIIANHLTVSNIMVINNNFNGGRNYDIKINRVGGTITYLTINDNYFCKQYGAAGASIDCITLTGTNISNIFINDNRFEKATNSGGYAIYSTGSTGITISQNDFTQVTSGGIISSTTGNTIYKNIGFVTENNGNTTFTIGSPTKDVTHGLSYTPTDGNIFLVPTTGLGNCTSYAITAYSSTTFTITLYDSTGAAKGSSVAVGFAWVDP